MVVVLIYASTNDTRSVERAGKSFRPFKSPRSLSTLSLWGVIATSVGEPAVRAPARGHACPDGESERARGEANGLLEVIDNDTDVVDAGQCARSRAIGDICGIRPPGKRDVNLPPGGPSQRSRYGQA
jgi:hypothetical protein